MGKVALYTRVSTNYQVDKDSLPHQRKELINYAKYVLKTKDYVIFEDAGFSGKNIERPSYKEMMTRIRNGEFTHLVVDKIDRISRNLLDFAGMYDELKELGVTFISRNEQFDTSSAIGEAILKIILVFAELERHMTSERVISIMLDRAEKGQWNGANVPLGYKWSDEAKFPVIDESEAKIVHTIFDMYEDGTSFSKISLHLNQHRIRTKRNGIWTAATVRQIAHNPFYKGTLRYNYRSAARGKIKQPDEWIIKENNHPALISPEQWAHVNELCDEHRKCRNKPGMIQHHKYIHVFSDILRCRCGRSGSARYDKVRKNGLRPSAYVCTTNQLGCSDLCDNTVSVSDISLGPFIFDYLQNIVYIQKHIQHFPTPQSFEKKLLQGEPFNKIVAIDPDTLQKLYDAFAMDGSVEYHGKKTETDSVSERDLLIAERQTHERAFERLKQIYLYEDIGISKKDFLSERQRITERIDAINLKLQKYAASTAASQKDIEFLNQASNFIIQKQLISNKPIDWPTFALHVDAENLNRFLQTIITRIIFYKKKVLSIEFKNGIVHKFIYQD